MPRKLIEAASNAQWRNRFFKRAFELVASRFKNRDGVIGRGAGSGLLFNPGRSHGGYLLGTSEPGVQVALTFLLKPGMTFYDIGANVGFHSMIAARLLGPSNGNVICFEPVEENARLIRHNAQLNGFERVTIKPIALSDVEESGRFWISEEPTWGSLVSAGDPPSRCIGSIEVRVRRLDDVIEEEGLTPPDVIKMDVEGAEVTALKGAVRTLEKHRPILLIELHGTNAPIAEFLSAANYKSIVFGSHATIIDSPWDAFVAAVPAESTGMEKTLDELRKESIGRK
ncbi:MAG: FkbM family methyltransferase [Candidatus Binataceae bacterium]